MKTITLYKPVNKAEPDLIEASGWPAEDLEEFNAHIDGLIEVTEQFSRNG